jgi:murein DD-endopeptidase MepM/ murein hydrolase activator NlpD
MLRYADGSRSTYGHLKDYRVGTGQLVARGEIIGRVGSSGRSTGPHVDFRLDVKGQRIDPLPLLHRRITVAQN